MIDVKQGVRTAFFQALNGHLTYNAIPVPINDELKAPNSTANLWVVLASQAGAEHNTFSGWASDETIDLDIVLKTSAQGAKEPLDQVAGQIFQLICPTVQTNGLPPQAGLQFLNVRLLADRYIPLSLNSSNTVIRRILTFKLYVAQL